MMKNFDELPLENFHLDFDFDETKFNRFLAKAGLNLDSVKEQVLYEVGCGEIKGNNFIPNNTCALFFALNPKNFIKQSHITCAIAKLIYI